MEALFTTNLNMHNTTAIYHVYFKEDKYIFTPQKNEMPTFSFKREHDEWHEQACLSPQLKSQAIKALENYLMAQH